MARKTVRDRGVAKDAEGERQRVTLNIPPRLWPWFRRLEQRKGATRTRLVSAGLLALRYLPDTHWELMVGWVTLLEEGKASFEEFEEWCGKQPGEHFSTLRKRLDEVVDRELEGRPEQPGRRQAGKTPA